MKGGLQKIARGRDSIAAVQLPRWHMLCCVCKARAQAARQQNKAQRSKADCSRHPHFSTLRVLQHGASGQ